MTAFESSPAAPLVDVLIFDLDGTLYDQRRLRHAMLLTILSALLVGRLRIRDLQVLRRYRRELEQLREFDYEGQNVGGLHIARVAEGSARSCEVVREIVSEWMVRRPSRLLPGCMWPGVPETLSELRRLGYRLALLSDYPASEKLDALGLRAAFERVVSCQDEEGTSYKPATSAFLRVARLMGTPPERCAYIGDRLDVDVEGAARAGMRPIWFAPRARSSAAYPMVRRFRELVPMLQPEDEAAGA